MRSHEATIRGTIRILRGFADRHMIFAGPCVNFRPTCFEVDQGMSTCVNLFFLYRSPGLHDKGVLFTGKVIISIQK